jgi:putative addiction module antidote
MTLELKLRKIGNSVGVVFPKEALARLNAQEGDTITLTETANGFSLEATDPQFAKSMEVFQDLAGRYRNALRELAK